MDEELKTNVLSPDIWMRLLVMVLMVICANVSLWVLWLVASLQFLFSLVLGRPNENIDEFSTGLLAYLRQIFEFLVFKTDDRPFPFAPFPRDDEE
ncbi:DUF4389 domain-containing protein [Aurantivibrio plasticivorans]